MALAEGQAELPQAMLLAIIEVQQEIVEADLSLDRVMDVVVRNAGPLTHADAAVVEVSEGNEMIYRAAWGAAAGHVGLRLWASSSLSGLCMKLDETLRSDDTESDPRVDREACRLVGARSMVVTPLRHRGVPIGALKVYASRPAAFDEASAAALRLLVGIIAATMHRAREHEVLSLRALHDPLTGLPNRHQFESVLEAKVNARRPFGLVYLDLNGFKRINDERGHAAGDAVLQVVARRLTGVIREHDLVARIGGDEFVVLLDGLHSHATAAEATERLRHRLEERLADEECTSASTGIALFPDDGNDAQSLLARADADMYVDKQTRTT